MGWLRLPLLLNNQISFWKVMGVGQPGFSPQGDAARWAILIAWKTDPIENSWWQQIMKKKATVKTFYLLPTFGHGLWGGRDPFLSLITKVPPTKIAVLTRASIKWNKAKLFWDNVPSVATDLSNSFQPEFTAGVGEAPYIRQATFSVWKSDEEMKKFAYQNPAHKKVMELTKVHQWYSEELFYRFSVIAEK